MRAAFVEELSNLARRDKRVVLLTGDLGYSVLESYARLLPKQFYNVGVAEQNMVGLATGLAEAGFIPFVYSIAPFACLRPYEFIRNGPLWHQLPVRIVGIGGGFEYGTEGLSHYALEDIGVWRIQPSMNVFVPADSWQAQTMLRKTWSLPGPIYYRISKRAIEPVPNLRGRFSVGGLPIVREGKDVLVLSMGGMVHEALKACQLLSGHQIEAACGVIASVAPPPLNHLRRLLPRYKLIVTMESHYVSGGIGSLVAEVMAETPHQGNLWRCGVRELPLGTLGKEAYLWKQYKLTAPQVARTIAKLWDGIQSRQ